ncbi:hypothetical protein [Escherichia coli]|uniref:hypothetical protein n=1 Tax=Escherichia coli TaxID=562 RepID=UPI00222840B6|nr:hypothetical protein [Escherichia coli]MCW3382060.1 hypothetical protein [Escherichia coli]
MGNAEALNFTLQPDDEQAKRNFFSRFFSSDNHQQGIYQAMNEEQFSQLMGAINKTSERLDKLEENVAQFSAKDAPKDTSDNKPEGSIKRSGAGQRRTEQQGRQNLHADHRAGRKAVLHSERHRGEGYQYGNRIC